MAMRVAIRELKSSLFSILAQAQRGEVVEVMSHNKPIARIPGIPPHAAPACVHWSPEAV